MEYLFNKFDEDGSNSIEFEEFRKWLEDNECRMTSSNVSRGAKRLSVLTLPITKPSGSLEERSSYVLDKLKIAIVKYNINLLDLFKKVYMIHIYQYDKSSDHNLDEKEMGLMLKRIEPTITEEET